LAWYPPRFRNETGPELLEVLMTRAPDDQRRPGLADCADLIVSGLRMRLRPHVPQSTLTVRAAVRLMYAGAAMTALTLVYTFVAVAFAGPASARLRLLGHRQPLPVAIMVGFAASLVLIALWLWMAHAIGQGQRRARVMSTALFALATLHLFGNKGVAGVIFAVVTWLIGLAAVWLLWHPSSREFFQPQVMESDPVGARSSSATK
jgi:hypothetical protein